MQSTKVSQGFVRNSYEIKSNKMEGGAIIRWLITHRDGAPTYSMRLITIEKGKSTPHHHHDYEHEIYIISGKLEVMLGENRFIGKIDDHIFIPPNIEHGMDALEDSKIICVVPIRAAREILGD